LSLAADILRYHLPKTLEVWGRTEPKG